MSEQNSGPCPMCKDHYKGNPWQRAWDATIFMKIHGFMTEGEVDKTRARIDKDYAKEGK